MPMIREKQPRGRNANVTLKLALTEAEAEKLATAYPKLSASEAMTKVAQDAINAWFKK